MKFNLKDFSKKKNLKDTNILEKREETINKDKFLTKIKQKDFSKKEEVLLGALILASSSIIGYYGFINGPQENRDAIIHALENTKTQVVQAKESSTMAEASNKEEYSETEVEEAVANYISNDPNAMISSEEFEDANETKGAVKLSIEHSGTPGELSQYLDTIASSEKKILVDNISYSRDLTGLETSHVSIKIPYSIVDGSLKSKSFMGTNADLPILSSPAPITAPPTTATPVNKTRGLSNSLASKSSTTTTSSFPKLKSRNNISSPSSNTLKPNPPNNTQKANTNYKPTPKPTPKPTNPIKSPVTKTDTPIKEPIHDFNAPALTQYSIVDSILSAESMDGLSLEMTSFDVASAPETPIKDRWLKIAFTTPVREKVEREVPINTELTEKDSNNLKQENAPNTLIEENKNLTEEEMNKNNQVSNNNTLNKTPATPPTADAPITPTENLNKLINREIRMNTGGIYLPKNGYELSFDIVLPLATEGNFTLVLSNENGEIVEVKEGRRLDLEDGYYRIFFPLNKMDGKQRATQFRYKFVDKVEVYDELMLRNFQILSHE